MRFTQIDAYDPDVCRPVSAAGFRVYPPEDTAWIFVPSPTQACSVPGVDAPTIRPVAPGTGT
jgi:hypothetical protein